MAREELEKAAGELRAESDTAISEISLEDMDRIAGGARFEDGRNFTSGDRVRLKGALSARYTDCIVETDGRLKGGQWTHGLSVLDIQTGERAIIEVSESEIEFQ